MGSLLDVPGIRVGHAQRVGDGWLTGVTAVLAPPGSAGGVDVRGGGPGTSETDALDPSTLAQNVDGVALCGGSAYGLAAAAGVQQFLESEGQGFAVLGGVVPIVPAAVIFDLGRGGDFAKRPDTAMGFEAAAAAVPAGEADDGALRGCVGAGTGAVFSRGRYKGGVGMSSVSIPAGPMQGPPGAPEVVLPEGLVVGALAVVNAAGTPVFPGEPPTGLSPTVVGGAAPSSANTTLAVVATNAALTPAECKRMATAAQAGLARALDPSHTLVDGDTVFALSTRAVEFEREPDFARQLGLFVVQTAGAEAVRLAILDAVRSATAVTTPAGSWEPYPAPPAG
ncbi:P1 family peptidase [Sinomonas gamaensis]|uniref:P1 family peptidase n=1 Tax=Sinomonas gamaensis TaxID=2565624 RepID=UPI0011088DB7|nr:P1 family peptidase [Sinomonas gamaensis]